MIWLLLVALLLAAPADAATWYVKSSGASTTAPADSCASADVQTAITASSAGDTIQLAAGSCTWTVPVTTMYSAGSPAYSGSGTSKHVKIYGAGTMPTIGAATSGGTTITDHVTGGGPYHNLILNRESPDGNIIIANLTVTLEDGYPKNSVFGWELGPTSVSAAGAKIIVMHHMTINDNRTGADGAEPQVMRIATGRGLLYRNTFIRSQTSNNYAIYRCLLAGSNSYWQSVHTLGTTDSAGDRNLYFEDNTTFNYSEMSVDSGCRAVFRFNELTNTALTGHGLDSQTPGARQFETYGNNFNCTGSTSVMNVPISLRGATQYHHNNRFDVFNTNCTPNSNTGHMSAGIFIIRDRTGTGCYRKSDSTPGTYPGPHQFGWGWTAGATSVDRWYFDQASPSTHVAFDATYTQDLQPSYVWNNYLKNGTTKTYDGSANNGGFGLSDFSPDDCASSQSSSDYIVENREWYKQNDSYAGTPTTGIGIGARASRPATCTAGTAWWASDQGSTYTSTTTSLTVQGVLDVCTATDTWTNAVYQVSYPHPLATEISGGGSSDSGGSGIIAPRNRKRWHGPHAKTDRMETP